MVNKTIVGACTGIASNISRNCSSLVMNQIGDPCYLRDCWDDANCIVLIQLLSLCISLSCDLCLSQLSGDIALRLEL